MLDDELDEAWDLESSSKDMLTCGMTIFEGIFLCLTSFFPRGVFVFSTEFVGLQRFSEES